MNLCDLEIVLKSLVLSCPFDLTMEKLARDFEMEIGYRIPFQKLGYVSLESLISSLEASFILIKKNGITYVRTKPSNKTSHIEYMVSAQSNKQRRKRGFRGFCNPTPQIQSNNIFKGNSYKVNKDVTIFHNESKTQSSYCTEKNQDKFKFSHEGPYETSSWLKFNNKEFNPDYKEKQNIDIPKVENIENKSIKQVTLGTVTHINESGDKEVIDSIVLSDYKKKSFEDLQITSDIDKLCLGNASEVYQNIHENTVSTTHSFDEEVSIFKDDVPVFLDDFPKNVALPGHQIPAENHIPNLTIGSPFCLFISEVHNPYKFWFHMEDTKKLDELMFKIELFYENAAESKEYNMHLSNMNPNQLCVALYNKYWHRAKILQIPVDKLVKVYFVDYGTVDYISISSLKYIHKDFIDIPSQAYRGCLAFLKPADMFWQRDCTYTLLSNIYEKKLWAKLEDFDKDDQIYHISLIDTTNIKDININKFLIMKGHASLCSTDKIKMHTQYLYPSFEMIENGEYPSFDEIGKLLAKGHYYEIEEYKTLKSINTKKLFKCTTLEFWNLIKNF